MYSVAEDVLASQEGLSCVALVTLKQITQIPTRYALVSTTWKNGTCYTAHCWITHGVSRLVDITAGGDFLGLCDQKTSYKHVSDFGRLRSYGHFLIPVHALV
jgi:hypothetical protein